MPDFLNEGMNRHEAIQADGKTDTGDFRPPESLDQAVIPPAADHGTLSAEMGCLDFESGARIVVEPSNKPMIERIRHRKSFQVMPHGIEMCPAVIAEMVDHRWAVLQRFPTSRHLAVKNP